MQFFMHFMHFYKLVAIEHYRTNDAFFVRGDLCPKNVVDFDTLFENHVKKNHVKNEFFKV